jgi:thymidylate synthase
MHVDTIYQKLVHDVMERGEVVLNRNGTTWREFVVGPFHFSSTPLVSIRKVPWKYGLDEFQWFMSGSDYLYDLPESVRRWWSPWGSQYGHVEFNYSIQFRDFRGTGDRSIDQIQYLIDGIKNHPNSRRLCITTWNTADMTHPKCPISNCHGSFIQCSVGGDGLLNLFMFQRSADVIVGLPVNWLQYWAFLLWLCHCTDKYPGTLTWMGGDVHVYHEHKDLANRIVNLESKWWPETPELKYIPSSEEFKANDFSLDGCEYKPIISESAKMVV